MASDLVLGLGSFAHGFRHEQVLLCSRCHRRTDVLAALTDER
jgi:hypothetical protein